MNPFISTLAIASVLLSLPRDIVNVGSPQGGRSMREASELSLPLKLKCKAGFKIGKTPISLLPTGKVSCVNTKSSNAGKKLLTTSSSTCGACHSASGITPPTQMLENLSAQGYTLAPASLLTAFAAHQSEMGSVSLTNKDAKLVSAYLQTQKRQQ